MNGSRLNPKQMMSIVLFSSISKTFQKPPTEIGEPSGKLDVKKRLKSEEGWVNDKIEMHGLLELWDQVLNKRMGRSQLNIEIFLGYWYRWNHVRRCPSNAEGYLSWAKAKSFLGFQKVSCQWMTTYLLSEGIIAMIWTHSLLCNQMNR